MGTRGSKSKSKLSEKRIQEVLEQYYMSQPYYILTNLYVFAWESDFLIKTKAGYWYEVEIKISLADFKNDAKNKTEKFKILGAPGDEMEQIYRPNYFSYCVPEELVDKVKDLVPPYAGLFSVYDGRFLHCVKAPEQLHSRKLQDDELRLTEKFYYNYRENKRKYDNVRSTIMNLRGTINWLKAELKAATGYGIEEIL